jgi:hypothetical protein
MNKMTIRGILALLLITALGARTAGAYSVLTHEQIIDLAWKGSIRPLLLVRYPNATDAQLKEAHAYAYGGCAIQDSGYYPFGHPLLSELTHYVRTGDFVANLIKDSRNVDELAFALGALSHYVGDSIGHHDAVNPSTAIEFPNLKAKYGAVVTYDEDPHAHVRTEFAFDIDQLSKKRIAPSAYWKHEGLKVPIPLLERAFYETYGLRLRSMVINESAAFGTYRWSVRTFLPYLAYGEVVLHRKDFPADTSGPQFDLYVARLSQADFNNGWEQYRKKAGIRTHLIAVMIKITPKIWVLSDLAIRGPQASTEEKYVESVNRTVTRYDDLLALLTKHPTASPRLTLNLENLDLDTGAMAIPGTYRLMDNAYANLLGRIVAVKDPIPARLKQDVEDYYSNPNAPISTKKHKRAWRRVQQRLTILESMPVIPERDVPALLANSKANGN